MARLGLPVDVPSYFTEGMKFKEVSDKHEKIFKELMKTSNSLPDGEIIGFVVSLPYADGYAYYLVEKERPLTLRPIPVFDAWQVPCHTIKGITRKDVLSFQKQRKATNKLFSIIAEMCLMTTKEMQDFRLLPMPTAK